MDLELLGGEMEFGQAAESAMGMPSLKCALIVPGELSSTDTV